MKQTIKNLKLKILVLSVLSVIALTGNTFGQPKKSVKKKPAKQQITKLQTQPNLSETVKSTTKSGEAFTSKNGRFTVTLPFGFSGFQENSESVITPDGQFGTVFSFAAKSKTGVNQCIIVYLDLPALNSKLISQSQIIEITQKNMLRQFPKPKIIKTENFRWMSNTGLRIPVQSVPEVDFKTDDSLEKITGSLARSIWVQVKDVLGVHYLRLDIFPVGSRVYTVAFFFNDKKALDEKADEDYFQSFRVTRVS